MNKLQASLFVTLLSLLLVTLSQSAAISEAARVRRSSADQRIAELQALLALSSGKGSSNRVAHGMFDPDVIGKKKRDGQILTISDEDRYNLLKALIHRAAQENTL